MTAVDLDALDKLRGALAKALAESRPWNESWESMADAPALREQFLITADALLPVVDRIANERAAAELRAAADGLDYVEVALGGADYAANVLRDRADALDPT